MVDGTFRAISRRIFVLRIFVHEVLEHHALPLGLPKSTIRQIPATPARLVATIEASCFGGVPLVGWALISATILEDYQSPCGARVAITSRARAWLCTNDRLRRFPNGVPSE